MAVLFSGFLVNWKEMALCLRSWCSVEAETNYKPQYPLKNKLEFGVLLHIFSMERFYDKLL